MIIRIVYLHLISSSSSSSSSSSKTITEIDGKYQ